MKTLSQQVQELVDSGETKRIATPYHEKPEFIRYYMKGWVEEYKEKDQWIKEVEKIVASPPSCLTVFAVELYKNMLETEKRKRSTAKRLLIWYGKCYDNATKGRVFYQPQTRGFQDLQAIKDKTDCRDLAEQYMQVRRYGKTARALCPFHNEKTPSFYAYSDGFKCYGCQWSGDSFQFVMEMDHCDFKQAIQKLNTVQL